MGRGRDTGSREGAGSESDKGGTSNVSEEADGESSPLEANRQYWKYQLAFEQSRDAIMFLDGDRFEDCNPATLALFRVPDVATFAALHPGELSPPFQPDGRPSRAAAADHIDQALREGQAFFEWRHTTWDGTEFPAEVLLSRIHLERGPLLQAVVRDISDRKQAELALQEREKDLAEAQNIAQVGSWVSDFHTNEIRWSDEVYRIFGMAREEWGASHESFMAAVHPADRSKVQSALEASFQGDPYDVVHRVIHPDGEVRTVRERGYTEFDTDGDPVRMVGTVQDITSQYQLEDNLRRLVAILDGTPDIVSMHGPDGTLLYLNAPGRRHMGLPERSSGEVWQPETGWDRSDFPPETEDLESTLRWGHPPWALKKVLDEGLPTACKEGAWQGETALLDSSGNEIPVSQAIIIHRDDSGGILQISTIFRDISERRALESQLRKEKALSESILASLPGVFYMLDEQGRLTQWNDRLAAVTGHTAEELQGADARTFVPEEEQDRIAEAIAETFAVGSTLVESRLRTAEGDRPHLFHGYRVELEGVPYILGVALDISKRHALEDQLRREKAVSESILDGLPGVFYMLDREGRLVQWNERMETVTGRTPEELDGIDALALIPTAEQERIVESIRETFSRGSTLVESKLLTVEGETPYLFNGLRIKIDGQHYLLGVGLDITRQKRLEAALEHEASTDPLTGVANRQRFDSELERALARYNRYGSPLALAIIDLDHFKRVNDVYGHDIGDRVLVELTERLAGEIREPDFLARWGGEEFVVLLQETGASDAYSMAERLRRRVAAEPFPDVGPITVSAGLASVRAGDNAGTLLKRADDALYEAKRNGRNQVVVHANAPESEEGGARS